MVSEETLREATRRLVDQFKPTRIILFGSYAWGTVGEDSDVDLLVVVSGSDAPPIRRAVRARRCLRGIRASKDVLVKTREELARFQSVPASLEHKVLERGKVLYGRPQG